MSNHMLTKPIMLSLVVNLSFGGFGLSSAAIEAILKRKGLDYQMIENWEGGELVPRLPGQPYETVGDLLERHDADLVAVVREMGKAANGEGSDLHVIDFVMKVRMTNYGGKETAQIYAQEV